MLGGVRMRGRFGRFDMWPVLIVRKNVRLVPHVGPAVVIAMRDRDRIATVAASVTIDHDHHEACVATHHRDQIAINAIVISR